MVPEKKKLLVIAGPTASGKSAAAVETAKAADGEIISADSMQVYQGMDIGTAKITEDEMQGIPHHMIDVADPSGAFDVTLYAEGAKKALSGILERKRLPILTGGTGFYIQAVTRDIDFTGNASDPAYRDELRAIAEAEGSGTLHRMLREKDPEAADAIHENNIKRVIRALEFCRASGEKISEHNLKEAQKPSPYDLLYIVLSPDREVLYQRCDRRIDRMLEEGLEKEARGFYDRGYTADMPSMQGLGYKELFRYFSGELSLDEAVYILKRDTRHYAKRQMTWFRREKDALFLPVGEDDDAVSVSERILDEMKKVWGRCSARG